MSHLILHVGTHKTGTTTIQDSFWANSTRFEAHGVVYPRLDYRHTGHHGLIASAVKLPKTFHLKSDADDVLRRINNAYADSDKTVFLSSKEFSRADDARSVNFEWLREKLSSFDRVTVLCFLRPQWRFLQSIYLEVSRSRAPPRPPAMVREAIETGRCQGLYMNYCDLMSRLKTAFSSDEIVLVDFESVRKVKGGILSAALSVADLELSNKTLQPAQKGHSNKSPHALSQWAANLLAEPYAASEPVRTHAESVLAKHEECSLLTRAEIAEMRVAFESSNDALVAAQRVQQPDFRISDPKLSSECIYREDISIEHWLQIGQRLARQVAV